MREITQPKTKKTLRN